MEEQALCRCVGRLKRLVSYLPTGISASSECNFHRFFTRPWPQMRTTICPLHLVKSSNLGVPHFNRNHATQLSALLTSEGLEILFPLLDALHGSSS